MDINNQAAYRLEALKLAKELMVSKMYMPKDLAVGSEGIEKDGHTDTEGCVHELAFVTITVSQMFEEYLRTGEVPKTFEEEED